MYIKIVRLCNYKKTAVSSFFLLLIVLVMLEDYRSRRYTKPPLSQPPHQPLRARSPWRRVSCGKLHKQYKKQVASWNKCYHRRCNHHCNRKLLARLKIAGFKSRLNTAVREAFCVKYKRACRPEGKARITKLGT